MKKEKIKKVELDISHILNDIYDLLEYESYVDFKIKKGLSLTNKERIFHDYMVSPSLLVRLLFKL